MRRDGHKCGGGILDGFLSFNHDAWRRLGLGDYRRDQRTGALIAGHPIALSVLTLGGALYLLWLGVGILKQPAVITSGAPQHGSTGKKLALKGMCISGLNPKVFLLFLALLPQFSDPQSHWPLPVQMSALALLHLITCTLVYLLVGYGSKTLLASRPQAAKFVSRLSGAMMVVIALLLLVQQWTGFQ